MHEQEMAGVFHTRVFKIRKEFFFFKTADYDREFFKPPFCFNFIQVHK